MSEACSAKCPRCGKINVTLFQPYLYVTFICECRYYFTVKRRGPQSPPQEKP